MDSDVSSLFQNNRTVEDPGFRKPEMECAFFGHMKQWDSDFW